MKKNTKYILIIIAVVSFLGFSLYDIQVTFPNISVKTMRFTDSTGYITTNRSFLVNGALQLYDTLFFKSYGSKITEGNNLLRYHTNSHIWYTKTGTSLMNLDSSSGLTVTSLTTSSTATFNGNIVTSGYNDFGNTSNFEKMIIIKGKLGTSSVGSTNIAHGFTGNDYLRITNFDCMVRNDTNVGGQLKFVKPNSWFSNYNYYAKLDSLYCNVTLGGGGTNNLVSDSVFFRIWYHP